MKKENSVVHLGTQAEVAPKIEAVPTSPASPDVGRTSLENETLGALQKFEDSRQRLTDIEKEMAEHLPEAGKEDNASILRYNKDKSDAIEWAKVMLHQLQNLKELEYTVTDPESAKKIKSALDFLEDLKAKYETIESPEAVKTRRAESQENIGVQLRNREQIELKDQEEKARKVTAVMRRDLANLKRSFYKMYGMTFSDALVLPSSPKPAEGEEPKGFWKNLANKVWEKPKSNEEKRFEAAKSKDAKALIKRIQSLDKQIESTWDDTMGQYAQESEPQTSISVETLRSVLAQEMPDKSAEEINDSAYRIIKSLRIAHPEEVAEGESPTVETGVFEIPKRREVASKLRSVGPQTFEDNLSEDQLPTLKKKVELEEEPVTLKKVAAQEERPTPAAPETAEKNVRKDKALEIIQIFGGGEQARLRSSNLFEAIENQMQLMKIKGMDPLDYVQLVAQRTKAENENNKQAADEYDKQIQALNEKLYFGTTDPSKGINMGASRLMQTRALGATPARAEAASMAEQIMSMPSQKAENEPFVVNKPGGYKTQEARPATLRKETKPKSLRLVKPEKPETQPIKSEEIPAPPEIIISKSAELLAKLDKPMDLQLAAYYVPNARLLWDMADKALAENPTAVSEFKKMIDSKKIPDAKNLATSFVYATAAHLRNQELLNEYSPKAHAGIVDADAERYASEKFALDRKNYLKLSKALGLEMETPENEGFLKVAAWDPDNLTEKEIDDKYAKAQETIPNYGVFARAVKEQTGVDDEALLKKYFVVIENYLEEVKRGDKNRINDAENAWRRMNENLGIEHPIMKDLLYSEPDKKSQMQRIEKRTSRSEARGKSWRP